MAKNNMEEIPEFLRIEESEASEVESVEANDEDIVDLTGAEIAPTVSGRERILDEASHIVSVTHENVYGDAAINFDRIAALWEVVFGHGVTVEQVALCMDLVKTARLVANPTHLDSWIDKVGYSALGGEIATKGSM